VNRRVRTVGAILVIDEPAAVRRPDYHEVVAETAVEQGHSYDTAAIGTAPG